MAMIIMSKPFIVKTSCFSFPTFPDRKSKIPLSGSLVILFYYSSDNVSKNQK